MVFQSGTKEVKGQIVTDGGRVLCATGMALDPTEALQKAYARLDQISFDGVYRRNDIGADLGLR